VIARLLLLLGAWLTLAAATPLPLRPPPPDLARLVPFAAAPLDKSPVAVDVAMPPSALHLPPLPPAPLVLPAAEPPGAIPQPPRALPCIGAWTGDTGESLECGRARFQRGEYEDAIRALESAARPAGESDVAREARYWLGETYLKLGRIEQADWRFRQVTQHGTRDDWGIWSLHGSGWTALRMGDAARARDAFAALVAGPAPASVHAWGQFGLGLAAYARGRYEEAERAWGEVAQRGAPAVLTRDLLFWHGEALGRVGRYPQAEATLRRFTEGGPHQLISSGLLRQGWWTLAGGRPEEAAAAFRAYAALPPGTLTRQTTGGPEPDWAQAGLALALARTGDAAAARATALDLEARRSPLALPLLLSLAGASVSTPSPEMDAIVQQALAASLAPSQRAWLLVVKGELDRAAGNRDDARTHFDLARKAAPGTPIAAHATLRLARVNFELREFRQALADVTPLVTGAAPAELRVAALALQGEAAYHAGDHAVAAAAYARLLREAPESPAAPAARMAAAWSALRQGQRDEARRAFLEAGRATPDQGDAADALVLAAELALEAGDLAEARTLLDRAITTYPTHPRTEFARLNRAILLVRSGDLRGGQAALRDWLGRAPFAALFGRAHAALGAALLGTGDLAGAQRELTLARREGLTAFASLGSGAAALAEQRWDDAEREFKETRASGTPDLVAAADYGLAAVAFHRGQPAAFEEPARAARAALPPGPASAPRAAALLYVLTGIAAAGGDWPDGLAAARRLVSEHPSDETADDALERLGAAAAAAHAWPVVVETDGLLAQRYPQSPFAPGARLRLAEARLETGRAAEARQDLERLAVEPSSDPVRSRALLLLARARQATGDRAGAGEAYSRVARGSQASEWARPALLGQARLLLEDKRWGQARTVLDQLLSGEQGEQAADIARSIGDTFAGEGDPLAAAEYYLTAAYVAPTSPAGRRGLLDAARALASARHTEAAAAAYRKLLAQPDLPPALAQDAQRGLAALASAKPPASR
jgi:tetratricopeptide (TPR) repeat protein